MTVRLVARPHIDAVAWDACVAGAAHPTLYGYCWYLDAVTSGDGWSWVGLVADGPDGYQAVMPVPLRRKWGRRVVHQPLFCHFLAVYTPDSQPDTTPFFRAMQRHFRYGSTLHYQVMPTDTTLYLHPHPRQTLVLDLSPGYEHIAAGYSRDRLANLRRAGVANWQLVETTDAEPLIRLFQEHHAAGIPNGVAPQAYGLFRHLLTRLQLRGLATIRYALRDGQIQAGALFIRGNNRIIYLFNAATPDGRRGNARTWLINQVIRENAGTPGLIFDFESPEKPSIAGFYASFGATTEPFWSMSYNRLTRFERAIHAGLKTLLPGRRAGQ